MIRRILLLLLVAVFGAVLFAGFSLLRAHLEIRALAPPLPEPAALLRFDPAGDLPVRLHWLNTARQPMPRSAVLEPAGDDRPELPYVMAFPAFALEWADGRLFLIDAGMDRAAALEFGWLAEVAGGAGPIEPLASVAEQLGEGVPRVGALAFTHLHQDHTQGLQALCARAGHALRVVQTPQQARYANYTTREGRQQIEQAGCAVRETLEGGTVLEVPGFSGMRLVAVGGHTPGGQIVVAHVRAEEDVETWVFAGDIANHADALRLDLPKPRLYSLFVVPEAPERLQVLRHFLRRLQAEEGMGILLSHDEGAIRASGAAAWGARPLRSGRSGPPST